MCGMDNKGSINEVSLKILPEALFYFMVQENDKVIGWLDHTIFVSVCIFGPDGWPKW